MNRADFLRVFGLTAVGTLGVTGLPIVESQPVTIGEWCEKNQKELVKYIPEDLKEIKVDYDCLSNDDWSNYLPAPLVQLTNICYDKCEELKDNFEASYPYEKLGHKIGYIYYYNHQLNITFK